jgi:hypothetical protein
MTLNIKLAEQVLDIVTALPQRHDQGAWRRASEEPGPCGTKLCIAGWAAIKAGGVWVTDDPNHHLFEELLAEPSDDEGLVEVIEADDDLPGMVGERYVSAENRAQRVLGLNDRQAMRLFNGGISNESAVDQLRRTIRSAKAARTRREQAG